MSVTRILGHTCTEIKSNAVSWNVTLSCLFSSLPCTCILRHFKQEISPLEDLAQVSIIQTNLQPQGLDSEYATQADWVTKSNLPLAILAYTTWYGHCHLVCGAALKHGIWGNIALFFYTIQTPIRYVGCLVIANTWTYNSLYFRNTAIFENKKSVCIFPHPLVNTCDLHLPTL